MTDSKEISMFVETEIRIQEHLAIAKDREHRREICLTWSGYVAAMLERGHLTIEEHSLLNKLLKPSLKPNDPVLDIFLGTKQNEGNN